MSQIEPNKLIILQVIRGNSTYDPNIGLEIKFINSSQNFLDGLIPQIEYRLQNSFLSVNNLYMH